MGGKGRVGKVGRKGKREEKVKGRESGREGLRVGKAERLRVGK